MDKNNDAKVAINNEENKTVNSDEIKSEETNKADVKETKIESKNKPPKKEKEKKITKEGISVKIKKNIGIIIPAIIAVVVVISVIVYFAVFHKKSIDLSDCIEVTYYTATSDSYNYGDNSSSVAYNGYATAKVSLNTDMLKELLNSKTKAEQFIEKTTLTIENENNGNLSNGDDLTINIKVSSSYLNKQKLKLKTDTISVTVEGLAEADVLDLFAENDFEIEVTGVSPNLSASVNNNSSNSFIKQNVTYSLDKSSGLANGDTITISANYSESEALEEGIIIANSTYEYTLENYPEYVESTDDITDAMLETLQDGFVVAIKDKIKDEGAFILAYNYDGVGTGDKYKTTEPKLVATYLLTKKGTSNSWNTSNNKISAIYKVTYTVTSTGKTYSWYFVSSVSNVAVQDGNLYGADDLTYSVSGRWDDGKSQEGAYDDLIDSEKSNYVIETIE